MDHADQLAVHIENSFVCTDTTIAIGILRVFNVSKEPNPSVYGVKIGLLSDAEFEVLPSLCKKEADVSNLGVYSILNNLRYHLQNNPFLTTRLPHGGKNPIQITLHRHPRTPLKTESVIPYPAVETSNNFIIKLQTFPSIDQTDSIPKMIGGVC
ncbi:hypothetical protein MHZ92_13800 [Sporosarcina sp. ACRSL]|uniref:hypothetical protein n=1 Tax=Sporosarcina sp. ACRSL TaxID=2918215 RepID=UPI001EF6D71C|nr:hypothetical protein [Sporosarcina sp. ACRSL]MCG7345214.1 hypothetical protein [Sporosarcina sp. ACRSL]